MIINSLVVGPFQTNCYIIKFEETLTGIIIDPGDESEEIEKNINDNKFDIKYIFHTHGHLDHIAATGDMKKITGAKTFLHKDDLPLYKNLKIQGESFGINLNDPPEIDSFFKGGEKIEFNGNEIIEIIHTPGHSPGCVCFKIGDILFSVDTLFNDGIGRTDLWGGSYDMIIKSINEKLFVLNDNIMVYPGHGPKTTIGYEKSNNPFISS